MIEQVEEILEELRKNATKRLTNFDGRPDQIYRRAILDVRYSINNIKKLKTRKFSDNEKNIAKLARMVGRETGRRQAAHDFSEIVQEVLEFVRIAKRVNNQLWQILNDEHNKVNITALQAERAIEAMQVRDCVNQADMRGIQTALDKYRQWKKILDAPDHEKNSVLHMSLNNLSHRADIESLTSRLEAFIGELFADDSI